VVGPDEQFGVDRARVVRRGRVVGDRDALAHLDEGEAPPRARGACEVGAGLVVREVRPLDVSGDVHRLRMRADVPQIHPAVRRRRARRVRAVPRMHRHARLDARLDERARAHRG